MSLELLRSRVVYPASQLPWRKGQVWCRTGSLVSGALVWGSPTEFICPAGPSVSAPPAAGFSRIRLSWRPRGAEPQDPRGRDPWLAGAEEGRGFWGGLCEGWI